MPEYPLITVDYQQRDGQPFSVTVCGYSGKIRHMVIGDNSLGYLRPSAIKVTGLNCEGAAHCLAFKCPLNKTEVGHVAHMLDMWSDEPLDEETAKASGAKTEVEYLVKFVEQMNEVLPADLQKRQEPLKPVTESKPKGAKR